MRKPGKLLGRCGKGIGIVGIALSVGTTMLYSAELKPEPGKPQLVAQGKQIFAGNCVPCHGERGKGDGPAAQTLPTHPRDLTDPKDYQYGTSVESIMRTVSEGIPGTPMAPWSIKLTPDQIRAVATYVVADLQQKK